MAGLLCLRDSPGKTTGLLPFPPPGIVPTQGLKMALKSPALAGESFTASAMC